MRCPLSAGWCHTGWPDSANIVCLFRYISIFGTLTERANIRAKQYTSFSAAGEVKKIQRIRLFTIPLSGCAPATWSNRSSVETNIFFFVFLYNSSLVFAAYMECQWTDQHSRICISNLCVCLRSKMLKFSLFRFHVKWERENTILASWWRHDESQPQYAATQVTARLALFMLITLAIFSNPSCDKYPQRCDLCLSHDRRFYLASQLLWL